MKRTRTRSPVLSRVLLLGAIVAIVFAGTAFAREMQRRRAIAREIRTIADEVERQEQRRDRLTDLLQHADSPEFLEREARLQLGLQRPGESVYVIRDLAGASPQSGKTTDIVPTRPKRWWTYFFD